jgi:hypothetical protein
VRWVCRCGGNLKKQEENKMTESKSKRPGRWKAGQSGNPSGRPPGNGQLQKLRAALGEDVSEILSVLGTAAKAGDVQAARLILERVLPALKPLELPAVVPGIPVDGTMTAKAGAVLDAALSGALAPGQAAQLIAALGTVSKIAEVDELTARIEALEKRHANNP